jgi:hypothetical protein
MEYQWFDDLTRTLAAGVSRRQGLRLLGSSLAGGLLAFLGVGIAPDSRWFCRKFRFLRQNLKTGCQKFNGLQTSKFPKKQICDRTNLRAT